MEPRLVLTSLTFSDGTRVGTSEAKIIALVGPNNAGKSSTLREIQLGAASSTSIGPVLKAATFKREGDPVDLKEWLEHHVQKVKHPYEPGFVYSWLRGECREGEVEELWRHEDIGGLSSILCTLIDVEQRLQVANAQEMIDFFSEAPSHPMHVLFKDVRLEEKVSETFRAAFKTDIVLNRGGGKVVAFHVGNKPELSRGEDSLSPGYFKQLRKIPFLHKQGHGMRSFVGCMLHVYTSPAFIHLLDEPEAFLHPPHAKLLAGLLARSMPANRQAIIATHSGDFLRGLLDADPAALRVIRLTREGSVNHVHEVDSAAIRDLWADPVLRFSNVLDAIFHEGVVLCESDSDCRFYAAILNAVLEKRGEVLPDVMFAASGGKDRMPILIRALRRLGVKIRVVADFDVLRDQGTLSGMVAALGGDWDSMQAAWRNLNTNIQSQTPPLSVNQVREQINSALEAEKSASVSEQTVEKIRQALKATSSWHYAKLAGVNALASGQPRAQLDEMLNDLERCGLFVVKCGEIERFVPSVGLHGPKWVAQALAKNLADAPELDSARTFVTSVFGIGPDAGWCQPQPPPRPKSEIDPEAPATTKSDTASGSRLWRTLLKKIGI
jgi:hypothetical protein